MIQGFWTFKDMFLIEAVNCLRAFSLLMDWEESI